MCRGDVSLMVMEEKTDALQREIRRFWGVGDAVVVVKIDAGDAAVIEGIPAVSGGRLAQQSAYKCASKSTMGNHDDRIATNAYPIFRLVAAAQLLYGSRGAFVKHILQLIRIATSPPALLGDGAIRQDAGPFG